MGRQTVDKRTATITRETKETKISVSLSLDGRGKFEIKTGSKMFDHMLTHIAQHGLFDIKIKASGWDQHHMVEDIAIALGQALKKALGDKKGIARMGHAIVPMDEALALVAVDISGRGYAVMDASFKRKKIGDLETDLVRHFLETFAAEAKMNLYAQVTSGENDHHKAEALFKALGRALDSATKIDARLTGRVPSTKGVIEG
ncbi:MAG: imidazoleglycerol-phosphate dehydratase [Dehalococcoidia bacterium DG_18]|nr:MAG: imidazoleglycerol-phosphate dehydratase [Dehalococcoidia bacterium DG_18]